LHGSEMKMHEANMVDQRIDKNRIAKYFLKSAESYDQHARIQDVLADNLLNRLKLHGDVNYERVLEVGCCTGLLTRKLVEQLNVKTLFLNDLVAEFEPIAIAKLDEKKRVQVVPFFGDIEVLEVPEKLDLCISSSTIQWLARPITFLKRIGRETESGGFLAISFFIDGTLKEMKEITRVGLNYMDPELLRDSLEEHYDLVCFEMNQQKLYFSCGRDVLHHIKNTGVGGISPFRWTKNSLLEFEQQYSKRFATEQGCPVTYNNVTIIARKR